MGEPADKIVVAVEQAEIEFDTLCEMWDIDTKADGFSDEEKRSFSQNKAKMIRLISEGRIILDAPKENVTYKLLKPFGEMSAATFIMPKGEQLRRLDKVKDSNAVERQHIVISSMIKQPVSVVEQMDWRDLKVAKVISGLFLNL